MKEFDIWNAYYVMSAIALAALVTSLTLAIKLTILKDRIYRQRGRKSNEL